MSLSKAVHMRIHNAKVNIPQDVLASLKIFFFFMRCDSVSYTFSSKKEH